MIKHLWIDERDGERLLTIGLTDVNLKRLQEGQPVRIRIGVDGLEHDRLVIYHATRESLIELADTRAARIPRSTRGGLMADDLPIRERTDKTPDHIVREKLLGMEVKDVIHYLALGNTPPRDTLYLVAPDGSAVEIEAERLYLDFIPEYEAELAAIEIIVEGE